MRAGERVELAGQHRGDSALPRQSSARPTRWFRGPAKLPLRVGRAPSEFTSPVRRRACRPELLTLLALLGCGGQQAIPSPARFDRPNRVDFVCVEGTQAVKLDKCRNDTTDNTVSLYALVTQSARGEVAAVDLETLTVLDSRRDIPGYTFVPVGVLPSGIVVPPRHPDLTYVAEFGSRDIRVLTTASLIAPLVGSAEVQTVELSVDTPDGRMPAAPTEMVIAPDESALLVAVAELGVVLWLPLQRCTDAGSDCHEGWIDESGIASIDLRRSVDQVAAVTSDTQPRASYEQLCGYTRSEPKAPQPISVPDSMLTATPRPSAFALDAFCEGEADCHTRLLVADEALPLIHAIDLDAITPGSSGGDALLPPLVVGVPTADVVVTPRVPVSLDSSDETQYVYAIDATDGSVLAIENGQVQNVSSDPGARQDRVELGGAGTTNDAAMKLAVLTPTYKPRTPGGQYVLAPDPKAKSPPQPPAGTDLVDDVCTDDQHTDEDPARLRGVFLAVAMTDGSVRIVDIHDREVAPAPVNNSVACRACPPAQIPVLVRNQARLASNFIPASGADIPSLTPIPNPLAFTFAGTIFPIGADGANGSPDAPGLRCMQCDTDLLRVFPPDGQDLSSLATNENGCTGTTDALVCAAADPWNAADEEWLATFEGVIPGTHVGGGRVVLPGDPDNRSGAPEVVANTDFCSAGVLGTDDVASAYDGDSCDAPDPKAPPVALYGDELVITSPIVGDAQLAALAGDPTSPVHGLTTKQRKACTDAATALTDDPTLTLALTVEIRRAYSDRLVIASTRLAHPVAGLTSYQDVMRCLGGAPFSFDVRTHGTFAVVGLQSGFLHRVKADADGRCIVDQGADPLQRGRARLGCTFRSRTLAFHMREPAADEHQPLPGVTLEVQNQNPATKLILNASLAGFSNLTIVPVQLRYNDIDRRLYLVDISDRGLVPISLDPFAATVDSTGTFN
jgi:hypothetical protein